ncbi:haloacid dehalogenase-like family hydrolase, putative [Theileria annulata]|uniref:Haloacid dehalogenase-like family hydrolase, putative n=1 Tax=Theileria annulata TaxID=5874 RepID=Q4UIS4_THEAN|nr:haloacid dehalogenase-like family hydrolase, putative [Theileria annulata]CAI73015.1 haloacid dehalogenase-like family hydrolase, putative [Theileria annulata]|eukprot:XP_953693.1 haloacid dehalogenase-like family hydrolase, putative [Theileria annulata]
MPKILLNLIILIIYWRNSLSAPISDFTKPTTLPKYFAIDVDGTFFIKDQTKFQNNVEAFKKLKEKNVTPFFCTGRDLVCTKRLIGDSFFNETGYQGFPGLYLNGALIYGSDGNLLFVSKFTKELIGKFVKYFSDKGLVNKVFYYTIEATFSLEEIYTEGMQAIRSCSITVPAVVTLEELNSKDIISMTVFKDDLSDCEHMKEVHSVVYTSHAITSITPSKNNKKAGLKKLLEHLGSNENECAFIGDDLNDIEPMEYCYLSFAVADAKDEVKTKAKWVLEEKHDECAFEKVVKLLYDD